LRFALKILESEGILTIRPRTGIEFVRPGIELTRSTFQFRSMIESTAMRLYAETADEADIREMKSRHHQVMAEIESTGLTPAILVQLEQLEELLHGSIVASLNNALIDTSYRRIRNYVKLIRLDRRLTSSLALRSLKEHMAIIEACEKRDTAAAAAALDSHFSSALQRSLGLY
jgi:DNA-binding GntR family transcriptional regulator